MNHLASYTPTAILAEGSHTELAQLLNAAMAADVIARLDYLFEYGTSWEPLPLPGFETAVAPTSPTLTDDCAAFGLSFDTTSRNYLAA